jgi:UDP-glucose 4-epimerase
MLIKSVVTGGMGFIGHHLVKELKRQGHFVAVVDNLAGGNFPERVHDDVMYYNTDIAESSIETLQSVFAGAHCVFHLAALPRVQYSIEYPAQTSRVNVGGTVNVLEAARREKVTRVIFASSSSVYGEPDILPVHEGLLLNPLSPYAKQKEAAEWYCRFYSTVHGLPTTCLRFFNVYGSGADPHGAYALVVAKFIEQRLRQEPMTITGDGTQTRDFTHVRDVVRAMYLASKSSRGAFGDAINIGGGNPVSMNEVAALIGGPTVYVAPRLEAHDSFADIRRAEEALGWKPQVSFKEGIAELKALHHLA